MAFGMYHRRTVQSVGNHIRRATMATTRAVDAVRPVYERARPVLRGLGVNTGIADDALKSYDTLRRAVGR